MVYSPAAKLNILHATFAQANDVIKECTEGNSKLTSMDTVLPVFISILARSNVEHLGVEVQFLEDFVDMDAISGESKILMTTLKAGYFQLIQDHQSEFM